MARVELIDPKKDTEIARLSIEVRYLKKRVKLIEKRLSHIEQRPLYFLNAWKIAAITSICAALSTVIINYLRQ